MFRFWCWTILNSVLEWERWLIHVCLVAICFVYFQGDSMPILASFLRKNQRALKLSTLTTLNVLVTNYGSLFFLSIRFSFFLVHSQIHISPISFTIWQGLWQFGHELSTEDTVESILPKPSISRNSLDNSNQKSCYLDLFNCYFFPDIVSTWALQPFFASLWGWEIHVGIPLSNLSNSRVSHLES